MPSALKASAVMAVIMARAECAAICRLPGPKSAPPCRELPDASVLPSGAESQGGDGLRMAGQGANLLAGIRIPELDVLAGSEGHLLAVGPKGDGRRLARSRGLPTRRSVRSRKQRSFSPGGDSSQTLAMPSRLAVTSRLPSAVKAEIFHGPAMAQSGIAEDASDVFGESRAGTPVMPSPALRGKRRWPRPTVRLPARHRPSWPGRRCWKFSGRISSQSRRNRGFPLGANFAWRSMYLLGVQGGMSAAHATAARIAPALITAKNFPIEASAGREPSKPSVCDCTVLRGLTPPARR